MSYLLLASQVALVVKNPPVNAGDVTQVRSLGWEDPLEEDIATHSVFLPGESSGTEDPDGPRTEDPHVTQSQT